MYIKLVMGFVYVQVQSRFVLLIFTISPLILLLLVYPYGGQVPYNCLLVIQTPRALAM